jgi:uncharacterized RDD family membrane protein YckC
VSVAQIGPVYVPQSAQAPDAIPGIHKLSELPPRPAFAGFWRRAVAYVIDTLLMGPIVALAMSFRPSAFLKPPVVDPNLQFPFPQFTPLAFGLVTIVGLLYYSLFEASSWQATPGKRILRLYVADLNGKRLTFARAGARNLARLISNLTFLVGYLVAGFTEKKQALHDILANCLVLRRP